MRRFIALSSVAALGLGLSPAAQPERPAEPVPPPAVSPEGVVRLIEELGHADPARSAEAVRRLAQAPEAAHALRQAAERLDSVEARGQAVAALRSVTDKRARQRLARLADYAKNRQADRMIETMVYWRESLREEDRPHQRVLARNVMDAVRKDFPAAIPRTLYVPPQRNHPNYKWVVDERVRSAPWCDLVAREVVFPAGHFHSKSVAVVRDACSLDMGFSNAIWFINNDFTVMRGGVGVLVCNGNVVIKGGLLSGLLVVCTGDFSCDIWMKQTLVLAGGKINLLDPGFAREEAFLHPKEKKVAEIVKWYDCREIGLEVALTDKQLRVTSANPAKPVGRGLKAEDVIEKVDGVPVADLRSLNRLLCRATVGAAGEATLHLRRGGQAVQVTVPLPE